MSINAMEKNRGRERKCQGRNGPQFHSGRRVSGSLKEKEIDEQELGGDEGGRLCMFVEGVIQEEEPASAKALRWEHS